MTTPKQKRLRGKSEPVQAELVNLASLLDDRFDELDGDAEFTKWRFPERDNE